MKFKELAVYLQKLESTASRNEITEVLAGLFKKLSDREIDKAIYLMLGVLSPSYKNIILNFADRMMIRALSLAFNNTPEKVQKEFKKEGDIGNVSENINKKTNSDLTINDVYNKLIEVAEDNGEGSQERKVEKIANLLGALDSKSSKFVARIPVGKLRLGFSDLTIIDALSWMEAGDKSKKQDLQRAYEVTPDIGALAKKVKEIGILKATKNPKPVLGIPVAPMLAQRLNSPLEMVKKMERVSVEPKFDGLRVGIHFQRGKMFKAYTRNLHDITAMFPELKKIGEELNAKEVILDSEAIGINEKTLALLDFQTTMTRRRKHDIADFSLKIPVKFCVFDILYKDGKSLMDKPYLARREELAKTIKNGKLLKTVDYTITSDASVISKYYTKELSEGLEGIIVKKTDGEYVPGRTGWRWVKMKQREKAEGKLSDTIDCVVMGYTQGQGKRVSFGLGQFLVGVKDGETIKTVTKVGTGLTDEQFRDLKTRLDKIIIKGKPKEYEVAKILEPDFWVVPKLIVEISGDDITKSPNHTAGYAVRFPRLVKFRDDKSVSDITTVKEIEKLYKLQKNS